MEFNSFDKEIKNIPANRYQEIFENKQRIYIPFNDEFTKSLYEPILKSYLSQNGYIITNYFKGECLDSMERKCRIGKVLNKLGNQDYIFQYNNDPSRIGLKNNKNLKICISKDPIDIINMSTGRKWTSCMDLNTGSYSGKIKYDLKYGSIIAYLIHSNDLNILNPIARILIKPYFNNKGDYILVPAQKVYGDKIGGFLETINEWAFTIQKPKLDKLDVYCCPKDLYKDPLELRYTTQKKQLKQWDQVFFDEITIGFKDQESSIDLQHILFEFGCKWAGGQTYPLDIIAITRNENIHIHLKNYLDMAYGGYVRNEVPHYIYQKNKNDIKIRKIIKHYTEKNQIKYKPVNFQSLIFKNSLNPFPFIN